ncbi:DUF6406 domain-containing protein [Streptomyces sp. NPDC001373]|uniref:DUF6406 domain-containing protein n=1 Tax=Streptomyces sp. NPDC001373 TaxID=3364565 RepID=UPI0036D0DDAE
MIDEFSLRPGVPRQTSSCFFGVLRVESFPGSPLTVQLVVDDGEERQYALEVGDTFPVCGELWVVDRVEGEVDAWQVCLRKVG